MVTVLSGLVLSPLHATIGENRLPLFSTHKQPKEQMIPSGAVTVAWPETSFGAGRNRQSSWAMAVVKTKILNNNH
jgi:hypothetical protein